MKKIILYSYDFDILSSLLLYFKLISATNQIEISQFHSSISDLTKFSFFSFSFRLSLSDFG